MGEFRVKLGRLPVGHKPHPPSSPRSLPMLSGVVDVSQEKRLHGRSIIGFIHLGGECIPEREAKRVNHVLIGRASLEIHLFTAHAYTPDRK